MLVQEKINVLGTDDVITYDPSVPWARATALSALAEQIIRQMGGFPSVQPVVQPVQQLVPQEGRIQTMGVTCPIAKYWSGKKITLTAKGSLGTPPYIVDIYRGKMGQPGNQLIVNKVGALEGEIVSGVYQLKDTDAPSADFFAVVTDSCAGLPKSDAQTCTLTVGVCPQPVCDFTIA